MSDPFNSLTPGLESPPSDAFSIEPNDTVDLPNTTRALNVAQAGHVRLMTRTGATATLYLAAGIPFPIRAVRVMATGTDAQGIVGLF